MSKREYQNDFPSVTQILGVLRKPALEHWFMQNSAEFCRTESARGKKIGTEIHEVIQSYIETGRAKIDTEHPDEVTNALKSFMAFKNNFKEIELQRAETILTSEEYKFNGTVDCIAPGLILDWKTANCKDEEKPKIWPEFLYQVSAYVALWNEMTIDCIDKAIIVAIAKDKIAYNIYEMNRFEIEDCFKNVFLPCLKIYNHIHTKKGK